MRPSLKSDLAKRTKFAILLNINTIATTSCHDTKKQKTKKERSETTAQKLALKFKLKEYQSTICFSNHYQNEMYNRTLIEKRVVKQTLGALSFHCTGYICMYS